MLLAVGAAGCGAPGAAPPDAGDEIADAAPDIFPDFGEIPDGHVLFVMSYRRADVAGTISPQQIYAQEFIVEGWRDEAGRTVTRRQHNWVAFAGWHMASTYLEETMGYAYPCGACGLAGEPIHRGVVYVILSAQGVVFQWDGVLWERATCPDGSACVRARPAPAGRHTVEFCPSYSHHRCPDGYDCHVGDFQCTPVEFDYPESRIVWYTHDCSAADEPGEFPGACL